MVEEQYLQVFAKTLRKAIVFWDAWVAEDIEAEKKGAARLKAATGAPPRNPRSNELNPTKQ